MKHGIDLTLSETRLRERWYEQKGPTNVGYVASLQTTNKMILETRLRQPEDKFWYISSPGNSKRWAFNQIQWLWQSRYVKLLKHSKLLEGVQRRATGIVEACRHQPYSNRLQQIGIPTLEYRRSVGDMVEVYKHLHFYNSTTVSSKFVAQTCPKRNHEFELKRAFAKDGLRRVQANSFYYRSIKNWNELPRAVVNSPSIAVFKKQIDIAWQNKRFI